MFLAPGEKGVLALRPACSEDTAKPTAASTSAQWGNILGRRMQRGGRTGGGGEDWGQEGTEMVAAAATTCHLPSGARQSNMGFFDPVVAQR